MLKDLGLGTLASKVQACAVVLALRVEALVLVLALTTSLLEVLRRRVRMIMLALLVLFCRFGPRRFVVVFGVVIATSGNCCCTCCAVTSWTKSVDTCDDCLDAGPPDGSCPAEPVTAPTTTASTTTQSTTTTSSTLRTTSSTTTSPVTQSQGQSSAYEERPELRGDFKNEEHRNVRCHTVVNQTFEVADPPW